MVKRVVLSVFFAAVVCGLSFYLAYFISLIYAAATGPLNPANASGLQAGLRHWGVPVSLGLAIAVFTVSFWQLGKRSGQSTGPRRRAKVLGFRKHS